MKFRVGLIGLGQIGALYDIHNRTCMTHLRAINRSKAFNLSFAIDPRYSVEEGKAISGDVFFADLKVVPEHLLSVDLLIISTPTFTHASIIKESVSVTGCKKVLCEKPLADTIPDIVDIGEFCRANAVDVKVNFMRRSLPIFKRIKGMIRNQVKTGSCDVFIGYSGSFVNNASHFIDLVLFLFPGLVKICSARFDKNEMISCDLEVGRVLVSIRPNSIKTVTDHRMIISTEFDRFVFEKAGRECYYYEVREDPDFPELKSYEKIESIDTDYVRFMSYVYKDVEGWMKVGWSNILCSHTCAENVSRIIEGIKDVAIASN